MELAEPFEMTQPAVSRHLKVLEGAGLIIRRVEGTKRPCRLAPDAIAGDRPVAGHAAPGLGEELRPAGRCSGHHAAPRAKGPTMSKMTIKTEGDTHVVVTRRFAAPPEAVYRAHTEPSLVQKWLLGPDGWTMPVCINEARPGGRIRYEWTQRQGRRLLRDRRVVELVPFSRIVHVERMHLPDATPGQPRRNDLRAGRRRHADDHAHDPARRADARGHAGERHGARHGSELRPPRDHDLAKKRLQRARPSRARCRCRTRLFF